MNWLFGKKKPRQPAPVPSIPGVALPSVKPPVAAPAVAVPESAPLTMGVSVFCGWANPRPEFGAVPGVQCAHENPWEVIQTSDRKLELGEYDERDPNVTEWRTEQMEKGKVGFACYQLEWAHEHTAPGKRPHWRPVLDSPLINAHCADHHPAESPVRFCVSLWDVSAGDPLWNEMQGNGWTADDVRNSWTLFAKSVATQYMQRKNYLRMDGRPVLFRGYAENLKWYERVFGITPVELNGIVRNEIAAITGAEPYIVATCTTYETWPELESWGFDAVTQYALLGQGWDAAMSAHRYWWKTGLEFAKSSGLHFWVPTFAGYDSTAWGSPDKAICEPTPEQFTAHLKEARKLAADNYALTRGMLCCYAWSEFGEGGIMEPMAAGQLHDRDIMLNAHRAATEG